MLSVSWPDLLAAASCPQLVCGHKVEVAGTYLDCSLHTHGIAGMHEGEPRELLMSEVNLLTVCDNIMFMKHWKYEASIWLHGKGQNNDIV